MHKITVNGHVFDIQDDDTLVVVGRHVHVSGSFVTSLGNGDITVRLDGNPASVHSNRRVDVIGSVTGPISTQGAVTVGQDAGRIDTQGEVTVGGNVTGSVKTQGRVDVRGNVGGDIDTMGTVTVTGNVSGGIDTMGRVTVGGNM
jgi:cytoskeletal protein CcmA (bactofilin family)